MPAPRSIAVATFGRSDFSILRGLVRRLVADPAFEVGLWVGGAHFEAVSGHTVADVEASGLPIWARVDGGTSDRSDIDAVQMMAAQMTGFAHAAIGTDAPGVVVDAGVPQPDLVLILGDRYEAVSAGLAMVPLGLPVGHISGGSVTEGAIDDVFRHCLTKIATVHFCDLPRFARRIHHMGEPPDRIFTTGALGLDPFIDAPIASFVDLSERFDLDGLRPGFVLGTLHPESRRPQDTVPMARSMVEALVATGRQTVLTYPNADPGSHDIIEIIESAAHGNDDLFVVRSFGADWFPSAMAHAALMVGNSSGGIIEAASFDLPVVDIGDRQKGREHGPNVIHCDRDRSAINDAIARATDPEFGQHATSGNIYGDGRGAERVIAALHSLDWSMIDAPKRFADPDPEFSGTMMELP